MEKNFCKLMVGENVENKKQTFWSNKIKIMKCISVSMFHTKNPNIDPLTWKKIQKHAISEAPMFPFQTYLAWTILSKKTSK